MSLRVQCNKCKTYGYEAVAGVQYDMPDGWVAVRLPYRHEQHYCSATCLLDSFVLPGVVQHTFRDEVLYGVRT